MGFRAVFPHAGFFIPGSQGDSFWKIIGEGIQNLKPCLGEREYLLSIPRVQSKSLYLKEFLPVQKRFIENPYLVHQGSTSGALKLELP